MFLRIVNSVSLHSRMKRGQGAFRHTASHILAQAVKRLYPETKLAIGPSVADGFYYDLDRETPFTAEDLEKIEAEMKKIVKEALPITSFTKPREEAIAYFEERNEPYKVELIQDLPEDAVISFYQQGEFVDLCAGPHLMNTKAVKALKLTSLAGAYWRGSEKNKMLTRIYGTAYPKKADLESISDNDRGSKETRSQKDRKRTGSVYDDRRRTWIPILPAKGNGVEEYTVGLLERDS